MSVSMCLYVCLCLSLCVSVCAQRALREVGLSSVDELKEAVTTLSCSVQKLHDSISCEDPDPSSLVSPTSATLSLSYLCSVYR